MKMEQKECSETSAYKIQTPGNHPEENKQILTNLFIPWSRVLLEKLTVFQLFKKFPAFYGTRKFITAFKNASHLSLS
jgi:hypothetical protein